jgi:hypothetical protein
MIPCPLSPRGEGEGEGFCPTIREAFTVRGGVGHDRCWWVAFVLTRHALLTRVTAHQCALPKFAYPGLPNLAAPALGVWRQNLVSHGVG